SLHLPRRRAPTHRSASPVAGSAAHAAAVEGALRERAAAIPAPSRPAVEIPPRDSLVVLCRWGKDAEVWPLTARARISCPIRRVSPWRQTARSTSPTPATTGSGCSASMVRGCVALVGRARRWVASAVLAL